VTVSAPGIDGFRVGLVAKNTQQHPAAPGQYRYDD
jgi:hypothetical protein